MRVDVLGAVAQTKALVPCRRARCKELLDPLVHIRIVDLRVRHAVHQRIVVP